MTFNPTPATELIKSEHEKIWIAGPPGSGKSMLASTFPGKSLVWAFGSAQNAAYRGVPNISVQTYEIDIMDMTVYSLSKDKKAQQVNKPEKPSAYRTFGKDFIEAWNDNAYDNYQNVIFDPTTMLAEMIMDEVLQTNSRYGKVPQQDDWMPQMNTLTKVFRSAISLPMNIIFLLHDEYIQDADSKKMVNLPLLTGKLKSKLPGLFNHLLHCHTEQGRPAGVTGGKLETRFYIQTKPNRQNPNVRTSFKDLDDVVDVTIENFSRRPNYGLGKILKEQK